MNNLQGKLADVGAFFGAVVTALVAVMDDRVRPVVLEFVAFARSNGIRGVRFIRHLYDRHLVAVLLRPALIVGTILTVIVYGVALWGVSHLGLGERMGESGFALVFRIAAAMTLFAIIVIGITWRVLGLSDALVRETRRPLDQAAMNGILPAVNALRQMVAQAMLVNSQQPAATISKVKIVRRRSAAVLGEFATVLGEIRRTIRERRVDEALELANRLDELVTELLEENVLELIRAQGNQPWIDALVVQANGITALAAPIQALLATLQPMDREIREQLGDQVRGRFGRPGLAPITTFAILAQWTVAGLVYLALGVILRTWYPWAFDGGDIRWTSAFIAGGAILLSIAAMLALAALLLAAASLRYGLGLVVWGARIFLRPAVQALPAITDENIHQFLRDDLGIPVERWADTLDNALVFPIGVAAGLLGLLLTQHSLGYVGFLVIDAMVLLLGYVFIVYTTGIRNKRIFDGIVVGHFVLAIAQFLLWLFGPMVSWPLLVGAGALALVVPFFVSKLFIAGLIAVAVITGWLSSRMDGKRATFLFAVAVLFGVLGGGAALVRAAIPGGSSAIPAAISEAERVASADDGASPSESATSMHSTVIAGSHAPPSRICSRRAGASNPCP